MSKKVNKPLAYTWIAYMITHEPEEIARVRKYGTPSDRLIKLAEKPIFVSLKNGAVKRITFPLSLNKAAGQKLLFSALDRVEMHLKAMPIKAYELFLHVKQNVTHRRSDTQTNLHMVAEALLHRSASEFKQEVLFAFDSINVWIKAKYGKELGYTTLHKALEALEAFNIIRVVEWGKRGVRHKATKIRINFLPNKTHLNYSSEVDDWTLFNDHAMVAVYKRESVTRQDVLEHAIHQFSDDFFAREAQHEANIARWNALFKTSTDATMTEVEVSKMEEVDDDYFTRLLGELVQPVHQNDTTSREVGSRVRASIDSS